MYFDSDGSDDYPFASEGEIYDDDQIHAEGIHAIIYRVEADENGGALPSQVTVPRIWAIKSVTAFKNARLEPHDIRAEAYALVRLRHTNIIELLSASYSHQQKLFRLIMPFIPLSLHDLLENPKCSPYLPLKQAPKLGQGPRLTSSTISRFGTIAKSFLYQIVAAVMFLHTNSQPIAHRDIKPSNILVRPDGCVKLIDFGISWEDRPRGHGASFEEPRGDDGNGRLNEFFDMPRPEWDETPERMCCQVSSGPYRAPELLFAPRHYDAFATDLWSLGVLASSFFTSLRFDPKETVSTLSHFDWDALVLQNDTGAHNTDAAVVNELPDPTIPFNIPNSVTETEGAGTWHRMFLFDSTRGEIGLVASIFKLLGTPTDTSWPEFSSLPAASALVFNPLLPQPMRPLLPNLVPSEDQPSSAHDLDWTRDSENAAQLIQGLVRYPPESRIRASDLLRLAYFTQGRLPVLPSPHTDAEHSGPSSLEGEPGDLAQLISQLLDKSSDSG